MTPFTDDELAELKIYVQSPAAFFNGMDKLQRLSTRLEAAENWAFTLKRKESANHPESMMAEDTWRKAAGK